MEKVERGGLLVEILKAMLDKKITSEEAAVRAVNVLSDHIEDNPKKETLQ